MCIRCAVRCFDCPLNRLLRLKSCKILLINFSGPPPPQFYLPLRSCSQPLLSVKLSLPIFQVLIGTQENITKMLRSLGYQPGFDSFQTMKYSRFHEFPKMILLQFYFVVAIDLIVQHIKDLLNNSSNENIKKRTRHQSETGTTSSKIRPH